MVDAPALDQLVALRRHLDAALRELPPDRLRDGGELKRAAVRGGSHHPKAIQSRMGHSSINVTLDRYGHLFPELDEAIATAFDQSLNEAALRRSTTMPGEHRGK